MNNKKAQKINIFILTIIVIAAIISLLIIVSLETLSTIIMQSFIDENYKQPDSWLLIE